MLIYAKEISENGLCNIGTGTDESYYLENGYSLQEVVFNKYDNNFYLSDKFDLYMNIDSENIQKAKDYKLEENKRKLQEKRYGQTFSAVLQGQECVFDTSEETQRDLQTAALVAATGITYDDWATNNGITLNLTYQDIQTVFSLFYQLVSPLYQKDLEYKELIENSQTVNEVENIEIIY